MKEMALNRWAAQGPGRFCPVPAEASYFSVGFRFRVRPTFLYEDDAENTQVTKESWKMLSKRWLSILATSFRDAASDAPSTPQTPNSFLI